jgi:hypothetical protein
VKHLSILALAIVLTTTSCTLAKSAEVSCNVEPKDLLNLLRAIRPLIRGGFGDSEIETLKRLAEATPVKDTGVKTFPISYQGKDAILRLELKKDDVDELEIRFITQKELAAVVQKQMRETIPN